VSAHIALSRWGLAITPGQQHIDDVAEFIARSSIPSKMTRRASSAKMNLYCKGAHRLGIVNATNYFSHGTIEPANGVSIAGEADDQNAKNYGEGGMTLHGATEK